MLVQTNYQESGSEKNQMVKKSNVVLQLSTPRSGSNITARVLGESCDECVVAPSIDLPIGEPFVNHIVQAEESLASKYTNMRANLYVMEHAACLEWSDYQELAQRVDSVLITQRDPSLVIESLLRKLLIDDESLGIACRAYIHLEMLMNNEEARERVAKKLLPHGVDISAKDLGGSCAESTKHVLAEFSQAQGFESWKGLQNYMLKTKDYSVSDRLLKLTHPELGMGLISHKSPQEFITGDPFGFVRACALNVSEFMNFVDENKVQIIDASLFRSSSEVRNRVSAAIGLTKSHVKESLVPIDIATANIAEEAIVYMSRALSSTELQRPFEMPIEPGQLPNILQGPNGLFNVLVTKYIGDVFSNSYVRPKNWNSLMGILEEQNAALFSVMERNPIFAYANVSAFEDVPPRDKEMLLKEIRNYWKGFEAIFDHIDKIKVKLNLE